MAYTSINFPTKKALRLAVADPNEVVRIKRGVSIVGAPEESPTYTGPATLEGPWYPKPHTWYANVDVVNGIITRVRS